MIELARVTDLEGSSRAALPALRETEVAGWLLRISGGDTKRVNSANPLTPTARVDTVCEAAERTYADHGLPSRFRLTPLAHPDSDATLAAAGYAAAEPSLTMVAPLMARSIDPALRLTPVADHETLAASGLLSNRAAPALAVHVRLLTAIPGAKAFAILGEGATPLAAGMRASAMVGRSCPTSSWRPTGAGRGLAKGSSRDCSAGHTRRVAARRCCRCLRPMPRRARSTARSASSMPTRTTIASGARRLVVVFGAAVRPDGSASATLARRVGYAAAAAQADPRVDLFLTGGVGRFGPSEASVMATMLAGAVSAERLHLDEASRDTLESVRAAASFLRAQGYAECLSCTDAYHQPRVRMLFRLFGVRCRPVRLPHRGPRRLRWRMILREAAALPYDAVAGVAARLRSKA